MIDWISFTLGLLAGLVVMFIIGKIADFIRVTAMAKYYGQKGKEGEKLSEKDRQKIKERLGVAGRDRENKKDS